MRRLAALFLLAAASAQAAPHAGVQAAIERRAMRRVERPVATRYADGAFLEVYADGHVRTQAVSLVSMTAQTKAGVEQALARREVSAALARYARALATAEDDDPAPEEVAALRRQCARIIREAEKLERKNNKP